MRNTFPRAILTILSLTVLPMTAGAQPPPAPGVPEVPALVVSAGPPQSFAVEGVVRGSATQGLGFRVASDGKRQRCALYDVTDGTPLFLSDGGQTLVYDLPGGRVARIPNCRGFVRMDWDAAHAKPLKFEFNVNVETDPKKLDARHSSFRVDRFVAASRAVLKPLETADGTRLFSAERADGSVEAVQAPAGDVTWFRFTSLERGQAFYRLELTARHLGGEVPAAAIAFPDPALLAEDIKLHDLERDPLPTLLAMVRDGRAWAAKMMLVAEGDDPSTAPPGAAPGVTWADLRERDKELGAAYRAALAKQGVRFETRKPKE